MHKNVTDITGQKFGRLTAVEYAGKRKWLCKCVCSNEVIVRGTYLRSGHTSSCGCLRIEKTVERNTTHGLTRTKAYRAWEHMKTRCQNSNHPAAARYQGRGITIFDKWLHSFETFYQDMGEPPTPKHTLERIDNDGPYSPGNCKWATQKEQNRNMEATIRLTHIGETRPLAEWAEIIGLEYCTLRARIIRGWPVERALTTPLMKQYSHQST